MEWRSIDDSSSVICVVFACHFPKFNIAEMQNSRKHFVYYLYLLFLESHDLK